MSLTLRRIEAHEYTHHRAEFTGPNCKARYVVPAGHDREMYVVYSYNMPLYAFHRQHGWFANQDDAPSNTTRRHINALNPILSSRTQVQRISTADLKAFIEREKEAA